MGTGKDCPSLPRPPPPPQLGSRHVVPGVGGGEKRRDFFGCSGASVLPSVSADNSGAAALCPGARARGAAPRRPEPGRGRCWSLRRHLRLLRAGAAVAWAAVARAPASSEATAAAARAASAAVAASDAPARARPRGSGRMWVLGVAATFCGLFFLQGKKTKRLAAWAGARTRPTRWPLRPRAPTSRRALRWGGPAGFGGGGGWGPEAWMGEHPSPALREERRERRVCGAPAPTAGARAARSREPGAAGGPEQCPSLREGKGARAPEPRQVVRHLWQALLVAPPAGERRVGQPGLRAREAGLRRSKRRRLWGWDADAPVWGSPAREQEELGID